VGGKKRIDKELTKVEQRKGESDPTEFLADAVG
jgi:hypothetical protein